MAARPTGCLGLTAAVLVVPLALIVFNPLVWVTVSEVWDERRIQSEMERISRLEFDFCYERKCIYGYVNENIEIDVYVNSVDEVDEIAAKTEALFANWEDREAVCDWSGISHVSGKESCRID